MAGILIEGMHGLGDNLHQRAIVRFIQRTRTVYLPTPWPQLYHDLRGPRLVVMPCTSPLRTQKSNSARSAELYDNDPIPRHLSVKRVWYTGQDVRNHGTILGAMLATVGVPSDHTDFRLPVPQEWREQANQLLKRQPTKPILFYRPLVERTEWSGCAHRNPDAEPYAALINAIRDRFYVVSVADLVPKVEWISSKPIKADLELHRGEAKIEAMIGLMSLARLAFCSPGFALVLAQAVGTPVVCVHGGRESSSVYAAGGAFTPTLGIDTIKPCNCFDQQHQCSRTIDLKRASASLEAFIHERAAA